MKKIDVCLWLKHATEQGTSALFPNGGLASITYEGKNEVVAFVPMAGGAKGLKPTGEGADFWRKIPYGAVVTVEVTG